jgi:glutaredoxin
MAESATPHVTSSVRSDGAIADGSARARCPAHQLLLSDAGNCPRCHAPAKADAKWMYLLLAGTFLAIFSLFLATRIYRFARDFRDEQNDAARTLIASAGARGRVVVYTTQSCPACKSAKAWLGSQKIEYVERLVDSDDAAMLEFSKLHSRAVPTFLVDGEVIVGLNQERIQQKLRAPPSLPESSAN